MAVPYPQVVLLGDSLFEQSVTLSHGFSFQAALQSHCIRRLDVVNRGLSGWNTKNVMDYLERLIPEPTAASPKIKYLIVLFGANDAVKPESPTCQHVPIDEYKKNLTSIITHPHIRAHQPTILLVTPPPIDEMKLAKLDAAGGIPPIRSFAVSSSYSEVAREVARANSGVILIDLWQALMDAAIALTPEHYKAKGPWLGSPENGEAGGLDHLLPDGLHMSGDAYRVLFEQICPHIGHEWSIAPDDGKSEYLFPDWREFVRASMDKK